MLKTNSKINSGAASDIATLQLKIGGMSCSFCVNSIEKALSREKGVEEVHISLAHEEALIRYRLEEENAPSAVKKTLRDLGFSILDPRKVNVFEEQVKEELREWRNLVSAGSCALVLLLAMSAMWLGLWQMQNWHAWTAWVVATYVFVWNGRRIIHMAWGAALRGITNQHVLLTVGAIGAYTGGVLGSPIPFLNWYGFVGFPAVDFFGVVVFLTTYHLLSGFVSFKVRAKASQSVRKLLDMQPPTARVVRDGAEVEIDIEDVVVGDIVRIRPGERVPVDGRVVEGRTMIDESIVTGEPVPAVKNPGDEVIGGSINQTGALLVEVTRVGEDSFLRQIARHVEEARAMKPGIIVLVDRILQYYVPTVLMISLAAFLFWGLSPDTWSEEPHWVRALYAAVTILVMGYPCALGMATPLALIRGGGMAAERGILIRSGEAFQTLKDITHIALDKTGTITEGKPRVIHIETFNGFDRTKVLKLAASAESPSEHPLGMAIVDSAREKKLTLPAYENFQAIVGSGVESRVEGHDVKVGTARFLSSSGIDISIAGFQLRAFEEKAYTAVLVAEDNLLAGIIAISDAIKPDAKEAIAEMKSRGLQTLLLTGDNQRTADAVASSVGIEKVYAEILPQEKSELVRDIQNKGGRVAMVGDGINDAPALMQADVGIAIGAGTDIAIESSDVILIGRRVQPLLDTLDIGASSYRKTVQNLWLAFFFNGVGVPLATTGLVHPSWAMIAMALSVTAVLSNSFGRLSFRKGISVKKEENTKQTRLFVPGIKCEGCKATIESGLKSIAGVSSTKVDVEEKTVTVNYDAAKDPLKEITTKLKKIYGEVHESQ